MGRLTHTVSGGIASFRTPSRVPIESLKFHFLPKQEGSGDPSPTNVRPITGWTGLNGRRAGKNIGHIIGYSAASMNSPTANKLLTNSYGTTIGTRDFILPDTPLAITQEQTSSWYPTVPTSYKNGYFCVGFDNLIFGESYDFSFKITNVIANPLNAQISDIMLNAPSGGQKPCSEVKDGNILVYKNIKWVQYTAALDRINRCTLEFRNCGMSFTISEIMVTPANKSDGVFESYSGEQIPVTFPDGQTIYGGYYDLTAGEIVAEWKAHTFDGTERIDEYSGSFTGGIRLANNTFDDCTSLGNVTKCDKAVLETTTPSDISRLGIRIGGGQYRFYFYVPDSMFDGGVTVDKFKTWLSENGITVVAKLSTPIHIPIPSQDLKAYLDYNNFWSDANDITEVTYEVAESRHILAERIKAMGEESGHHRKVKWNQVVHDGNFTNKNWWYFNSNYGSLSTNNNVITWTCTTQPTQFYHTGFTRDSIRYTNIPWNHKVLVRAMVRCSITTLIRLYAMVGDNGNTHTYYYGKNISANEWTELFGFISDRPETPPAGINSLSILRFKPCIFGTERDITTVTVGTTLEAKDMVAFDLTQMFGLGNEPQTVAEFEHVCAINGIDLITYQPYDEGSDRWLIVP